MNSFRILQNCTIVKLAKKFVCDVKTNHCILRQCNICKNTVLQIHSFADSSTYYNKWVVKTEPRIINGREKLVKRTVKDTIQINKVDFW